MSPWIAALGAVIGYLIGSISSARLVTKWVSPETKIDNIGMSISSSGESHTLTSVGGTAVGLTLGPKWGGTTALLDIAKVAIPTLATRLAFPGQYYYLVVALAALIGHVWPIYFRFNGGGGMSAIYGGLLVVDWVGALATAFLGLFLGIAIRNAFILYMGGIVLIIPWMVWRWGDWQHVAYAVLVNVLFMLAMIPETKQIIERKRRGERDDFDVGLDMTPMGRMIAKMLKRRKAKEDA